MPASAQRRQTLFRPVAMRGRFGAKKVNVRAQQQDPHSLLRWFENLIHTLRTAPEIGTGTCSVIDAALPRSVLAHRFDAPAGSILLLHNLADTTVTVDIGAAAEHERRPVRPVRGRPIPRTDQEADRPRARRLGQPTDTSVPKRSRLAARTSAVSVNARRELVAVAEPSPSS